MEDWERSKGHRKQDDIESKLVLPQYLLKDDDYREGLIIFCANSQPFEAHREMRTSG